MNKTTQHLVKFINLIAVVIFAATNLLSAEDGFSRNWSLATSPNKKFDATLVSYDQKTKNTVLRNSEGKEVSINAARLSSCDTLYLELSCIEDSEPRRSGIKTLVVKVEQTPYDYLYWYKTNKLNKTKNQLKRNFRFSLVSSLANSKDSLYASTFGSVTVPEERLSEFGNKLEYALKQIATRPNEDFIAVKYPDVDGKNGSAIKGQYIDGYVRVAVYKDGVLADGFGKSNFIIGNINPNALTWGGTSPKLAVELLIAIKSFSVSEWDAKNKKELMLE